MPCPRAGLNKQVDVVFIGKAVSRPRNEASMIVFITVVINTVPRCSLGNICALDAMIYDNKT